MPEMFTGAQNITITGGVFNAIVTSGHCQHCGNEADPDGSDLDSEAEETTTARSKSKNRRDFGKRTVRNLASKRQDVDCSLIDPCTLNDNETESEVLDMIKLERISNTFSSANKSQKPLARGATYPETNTSDAVKNKVVATSHLDLFKSQVPTSTGHIVPTPTKASPVSRSEDLSTPSHLSVLLSSKPSFPKSSTPNWNATSRRDAKTTPTSAQTLSMAMKGVPSSSDIVRNAMKSVPSSSEFMRTAFESMPPGPFTPRAKVRNTNHSVSTGL